MDVTTRFGNFRLPLSRIAEIMTKTQASSPTLSLKRPVLSSLYRTGRIGSTFFPSLVLMARLMQLTSL
jgi:hypothetical protein